MRIVRGLTEAREVLCRDRGLNLTDAHTQVLARTEEAFGEPLTPAEAVQRILDEVREHGDDGVRDLTRRIDGADIDSLEVPSPATKAAYEAVSEQVVEGLRLSTSRIREFHQASKARGWMDFSRGYGQMINPVASAGIYVPGGRARYPSTVLMTAVPAKVAGVDEVVICSPPRGDGLPDPVVLVAADIAGVDRVFRIGGAQAIAAMAYGTETVPGVDMVCGPGNIFVTIAKKLVFGEVGIDGLYGPTETLLIADDTANPTLCAVDLLAQAEHDVLATPVLITTSTPVAETVAKEIAARLERLDDDSPARAAIEGQACIAIVDDVGVAVQLANELAPEHLSLMVRDPWDHLGDVRNAGAVFVGDFSHEVLGDYVAGPSHVMPTGGTARFSSGLGVHSFLKISPIVALDDDTSAELGRVAAVIARAEGLTAHAEAAEVRQELLERQ